MHKLGQKVVYYDSQGGVWVGEVESRKPALKGLVPSMAYSINATRAGSTITRNFTRLYANQLESLMSSPSPA